jgi:hypothetical protein
VDFDGTTAVVQFTTSTGFYLDETHLYLGAATVPTGPSGNPTVAPGQYPYIHSPLPDNTTEDTFPASEIGTIVTNPDGSIYVIAHATVCGDYPE